MKTIYKYRLKALRAQRILVPAGAKPLSVQMMGSGCYMWALVEDGNLPAEIDVYAIGTGCRMPDEALTYTGTCQMEGGLVFHFFWRGSDVTDAKEITETI
jgi:hypothetical protein